MASDKRMATVLFLLQAQAAFSGSSSYKSHYGTSVSAKGTLSHGMLLKQQQREREQQLLRSVLLRTEADGNGDDENSDIQSLSKESANVDSLPDLEATLHADNENNANSDEDSRDSKDSDSTLANLGDDLQDGKTGDGAKDSGDLGGSSLSDVKDSTKSTDDTDDAVQQSVTLAGLEQGAKDGAQDEDLMKSLKADMAADNVETGNVPKEPSLDDAASTLNTEQASFTSINADLATLHKQIYGDDPKAKNDTSSLLNSSLLQVPGAQKTSDWLDKELGEIGDENQNTTEAHSWLDEEYSKLQKSQR